MTHLLATCLFLTGVLLLYVGIRMLYLQYNNIKAKGTFWVERKLSQVIIVLWWTYLTIKVIID